MFPPCLTQESCGGALEAFQNEERKKETSTFTEALNFRAFFYDHHFSHWKRKHQNIYFLRKNSLLVACCLIFTQNIFISKTGCWLC